MYSLKRLCSWSADDIVFYRDLPIENNAIYWLPAMSILDLRIHYGTGAPKLVVLVVL